MSFKDWSVRHETSRAPELTEPVDPYWGRPLDGLDEVPLSSRRQMQAETSLVANEGIVQDIKMAGMFRYHLRDWMVIILCIILDVILNIIHPYPRFVGKFNIDSVSFPLRSNTVPLWAVPIIAIGIPTTVFVGYYIKRRDSRDFHQAVLGLLTAIAITAVFTDAIKDGVGRARPDFLYRCSKSGQPLFDNNQEVICDGDPAVIREGHKSFPSGHSSWSFAGLGYLSFYLAGKVTFFDRRGFTSRILIVFFPLLLASLVAVSRVSNYWHHWQDVTVGGLLGLSIAYFSYRQHFPEFSDKMAGVPYPHMARSSPLSLTSRNNNAASWGTSTPAPPVRATSAAYDVEAA